MGSQCLVAFGDVGNGRYCRRTVGICWMPQGKDCHSDCQIEDKQYLQLLPATVAVQYAVGDMLVYNGCFYFLHVLYVQTQSHTSPYLDTPLGKQSLTPESDLPLIWR